MSFSFYEFVGFIAIWSFVIWILSKIARGLWTCWLADSLGFSAKWKPGPNTWAIVTGATDGIGLEYANEMAKKGYCLLLISRNPDKLEQTKQEIKSKYTKCGEIRTLAADFSKINIYDSIEKEIKKLGADIDVLVNNVGVSYVYAEYFTQLPQPSQLIESIINVNMVSCTKMMQFVLPVMEKRRRGIVINVSSLSGTYPSPLLSLYAASKVYVDFLSRALQVEYQNKGLIIQSVLPAYVKTNMSKIRKTSFLVPTPSNYVKGTLKTVGVETRTYGYWTHKIQGFIQDRILANIPVVGEDLNITIIFNAMRDVRSRYYKKNNMSDKNK